MNESTLTQLYNSAISAFPFTTRRQHATDTVTVSRFDWVPFLGMKTLFVKGYIQNEGKEYSTIVLFKKMNYMTEAVNNAAKLKASDGLEYYFDKITESQEALVRCNCLDFSFRFNYYNHLDSSLYGRKRAKYEGIGAREPVNPKEMPGMCKHLIKTISVLQQSGIFL